VQDQDVTKENKGNAELPRSTHTNGKDTTSTVPVRRESKMPGAYGAFQFAVSEQQYSTVSEEHSKSMNLLNSSASALLGAMESCVPPKDSGRVIGEYTGQNMRQIAKSICDIINTKTNVVRSMYSIARDER
jgi:hypothetical protein